MSDSSPRRPGERAALAVGLLALLAGAGLAPARTWGGVLLWSWLAVGVGLAGALTIAVQYAHRAPGAVGLRRCGEILTAALPVGAIGVLAVLLLHPDLFPGYRLAGEHAGFKAWWLGRGFHVARAAGILAVWLLAARALVTVSRARAAADSPALAARHGRLAAGFFYLFAITLSIASVDWLMALEPHWYSTIFGLYQFAGLALSGTAVVVLVLLLGAPADAPAAGLDRRHDLGQLLIALACLWMYLWFSQYLLIWYTGLPEETAHYVQRLSGGWWGLFYLNLFLNGLVPFFVLLPREAKQSAPVLVKVAAVVLVGRWLDASLMIAPAVDPSGPVLHPVDIGLAIGAVALLRRALARAARR